MYKRKGMGGKEWSNVNGHWVYDENKIVQNGRELSAKDDTIETGSGDDVLLGSRGNDTLIAWFGDDTMNTGWGDDKAFGGRGNDVMRPLHKSGIPLKV